MSENFKIFLFILIVSLVGTLAFMFLPVITTTWFIWYVLGTPIYTFSWEEFSLCYLIALVIGLLALIASKRWLDSDKPDHQAGDFEIAGG